MPIISGVKTDAITLGKSTTDSQNFQLSSNNDGTAKLSRGSDGSLGDILTVASDGKVTLNAVLTNRFTSAEQTITSAGNLNIDHGLGVVPFTVNCFLVCKTAEAGYSINDVICTSNHQESSSAADTVGISLSINATNLTIRYGSNTNTFNITNKTTGTGIGITNANWRLIVKAEA